MIMELCMRPLVCRSSKILVLKRVLGVDLDLLDSIMNISHFFAPHVLIDLRTHLFHFDVDALFSDFRSIYNL